VVQITLDEIPSAEVKVYVVWEPILPGDREGAAKKSQELVSDRRSRHFWAPDLELARRFQNPIGLITEPAWDVYLLYGAEATWPDDTVPTPSDFMHQLAGRLPGDKVLDGPALTRRVMNLVGRAQEGVGPKAALHQKEYLEYHTFQQWRSLVPELHEARVCGLTTAGHRLWASGQLRMPTGRFLHGEFRKEGTTDWAVELSSGPDTAACRHLLVVTNEDGVWRRLLLLRVELEPGTAGFTVVWSRRSRALGIDFGHRRRLTGAATMTWDDGHPAHVRPGYVIERHLIRQLCRWSREAQRFECTSMAIPEEWDSE